RGPNWLWLTFRVRSGTNESRWQSATRTCILTSPEILTAQTWKYVMHTARSTLTMLFVSCARSASNASCLAAMVHASDSSRPSNKSWRWSLPTTKNEPCLPITRGTSTESEGDRAEKVEQLYTGTHDLFAAQVGDDLGSRTFVISEEMVE